MKLAVRQSAGSAGSWSRSLDLRWNAGRQPGIEIDKVGAARLHGCGGPCYADDIQLVLRLAGAVLSFGLAALQCQLLSALFAAAQLSRSGRLKAPSDAAANRSPRDGLLGAPTSTATTPGRLLQLR